MCNPSAFTTGGSIRPPYPESSIVYIGPDALMPLASAIAAIAGFFLMFWRRIVGAVKLIASKFGSKQ